MSSENQIEFTKENIDTYLKEVAKDYPGVEKEENINGIAEKLQKKTNKASILMQLKAQTLTEDQQ